MIRCGGEHDAGRIHELPERGRTVAAGGDMRWFVVRTKPHQETRAAMNISNQGMEVFQPKMLSASTRKSASSNMFQPVFPGYLFVRFDANSHTWRSLNSTFGVLHLLTNNEVPVPVPVGLVEGLIQMTQENGCMDMGAVLSAGQAVKLMCGPFKGVVGMLAGVDRHKRAKVLLQIMGREIRLETQAQALLPA